MDNKALILDIAMNLNRVGNWAADDYYIKKKRIRTFLDETKNNLSLIQVSTLPQPFSKTYMRFLKEFSDLAKKEPRDVMEWAESLMTWGNILTHRSKLLK